MALIDMVRNAVPKPLRASLRESLSHEDIQRIGHLMRGNLRGAIDPYYFIHIPKNAGSSIVTYIQEHRLPFVILDHNLRHPNYQFPHEVSSLLNMKAFCVVRDPFVRLASAFVYLQRGGNNPQDAEDYERYLASYGTFKRFVLEGLGDPDARSSVMEQIHLRTQASWIIDNRGHPCVWLDNIVKMEHLDTALPYIFAQAGHTMSALPHLNATGAQSGGYHKMYLTFSGKIDEEMCAAVVAAYSEDFARFGYPTRLA